MDIGVADGAEEGERGDRVTVEALTGTVLEKVELFATYPLMRNPLCELEKPRLNLHEVLKLLMALDQCARSVGMAFRRRCLVEIEANESDGEGNMQDTDEALAELFEEGRYLCAMTETAMDETVREAECGWVGSTAWLRGGTAG